MSDDKWVGRHLVERIGKDNLSIAEVDLFEIIARCNQAGLQSQGFRQFTIDRDGHLDIRFSSREETASVDAIIERNRKNKGRAFGQKQVAQRLPEVNEWNINEQPMRIVSKNSRVFYELHWEDLMTIFSQANRMGRDGKQFPRDVTYSIQQLNEPGFSGSFLFFRDKSQTMPNKQG